MKSDTDTPENYDEAIRRAADAVRAADALLICAGAGMGVDSGLPDFRGDSGFWKAYPALAESCVRFAEIASPDTFRNDPQLAWGFYGHRLNLYRETVPHAGFAILRRWADTKRHGAFIFTSNVDGQFQKAGFDAGRVAECHGSIHHLQCLFGCSWDIWSADKDEVVVDEANLAAAKYSLPRCIRCQTVARPNVLMFNDWGWLPTRADAQHTALEMWLGEVLDNNATLAVIEIGAGQAIPTVRRLAERVAATTDAALVRINPRAAQPPHGVVRCVSLPMGALAALSGMDGVGQ